MEERKKTVISKNQLQDEQQANKDVISRNVNDLLPEDVEVTNIIIEQMGQVSAHNLSHTLQGQSLPLSSFETLYDKNNEVTTHDSKLTSDETVLNIGDKHYGTISHELAQGSFENIYGQICEDNTIGANFSSNSDIRWSVPGSGKSNERTTYEDKLSTLGKKIDQHWKDIENIVGHNEEIPDKSYESGTMCDSLSLTVIEMCSYSI